MASDPDLAAFQAEIDALEEEGGGDEGGPDWWGAVSA